MAFKIEDGACIRCGICVSLAPDVFYFKDDGSIGVKEGDGSVAASSCPTGAIVE